ncbi:8732_t:CDS:2 [Entrophospora sp. SA101]|nr:8732_t:CDS:2 [Entrophospora sp. SA101]
MQCPRKRGPRVGLVESLERRLQQMEKLLQPLKEQGIVVGEEDDVLIYFGKTSAKPGLIPKKETFCGDADDNDIMHTTTTNSSENSSESSGNRQDIVRNPRYLSGEGYAEIASQMIFHTIDRPTLLLLTLQSYGAMKGPRCWTYLGIAIRMAQEIGLHRIDESLGNSSHSIVDDEMAFIKKETRRRTFWLGFTLDRFSACALGRPHMIQESDCDVRLPCKEEIWNLEHPFTSPKIDEFRKESKEKQGLLLKLAKCGLCACLVSVAALLGRACQYVNRSNSRNISQPWDPKSEYVQLEGDIKSWHSSISPHYDYSFEKLQKYMSNGTGVSFATMHIVYHATVVVLNRHSFSRSQQNDGVTPDVEFVKKSDAKCTEAARFASEIAKDIISIGCSNMFPFSVYGVFATASIHINDSFSNDKELAQNAKKCLKIDEQYLRDMESHWATAGKLATLMKEMIIAKESNNKSDITPFYNYNNNEFNGRYDNNNNIYNNFGGLENDNIGIINNNMVPMSDQTFINGGGESWTSLLRSPYILTPRTLQRGGIDYFTQSPNVFGSQYPTITYENVPLVDASSSSTTGFIPPEFSSTNANTSRFPPLM